MKKHSFISKDISTSAVMFLSLAYFGPECAAQRPGPDTLPSNSREAEDFAAVNLIFNRKNVPLSNDTNRARYFRRLVSKSHSEISSKAAEICEYTLTKEEICDRLLKWTRENIEVESDHKARRGYIQEPLETLRRGRGTSREVSVLYAAMCHAEQIETMLLDFGPHMSVAVESKHDGHFWLHLGRRYTYMEPSQSVLGVSMGKKTSSFMPEMLAGLSQFTIPIPCTRTVRGRTADGRNFSIEIEPESFFASKEDPRVRRDYPEFLNRDGKKKFIASVFIKDDPVIAKLSQMLAEGARSKEEAAQNAFDFVQTIPYIHDLGEYYRPAIETLYEGRGDCEDTTALLVSIWRHMGLEACVFVYDDHVAAGIAGNFRGQSMVFNDVRYFFAETTAGGGMHIGEATQDKYRPIKAETFALPPVRESSLQMTPRYSRRPYWV